MRAVSTAAMIVALTGCVPYGDPEPAEPPMDLPASYGTTGSEQGNPGHAPASASSDDRRWWMALNDPALDRLEQRALAGNFSLGAAWARLEQAHALARQAAAPRYPQVVPQAQAGWRRSSASFLGSTTTYNLSASVPVTYEVDWFAKYEGQAQAADYDAMAARGEVESAAITLTANVAEAWYDLVEARAQRTLLEKQLDTNQTFLDLTKLRFQQGLTSALDVHQQRQQTAATQAQLDLVRAQERLQQNRLAVLLGEAPTGEMTAPARSELPEVPPLPATGVPGDLLVDRPDVRAAMRRVQAADERAGAAVAAYLPSLVLNASVGYAWQNQQYPQGSGFGSTFPSTTHGPEYSAGASLSVPLFDGFQHKAKIDQSRAQLREAMATYGQTVQQAMVEVQNAVAQEQEQRDRITHLEEQLAAANDALDSARERYQQGLTDFLNVLTALQAQQQTELTLLDARRQLLSYRIQLHRALGGTWTRDLEPQSASARTP